VFTTVHANNVIDVLGRFLNMGVEPYQFVSALNCVLAQRLVRIICSHCKRPVKVARAQLEESAHGSRARRHAHLLTKAAGASSAVEPGSRAAWPSANCSTSRTPSGDDSRSPASSEIKKMAHDEGMRFLRESAVEKVLQGATTLREINKVTFVE
jgi:type IV pilus assembly protein PilB